MKVTAENIGTDFDFSKTKSVLVVGDSMSDDYTFNANGTLVSGDFPLWLWDYGQGTIAIATRGLASQQIKAGALSTYNQLVFAMSETDGTIGTAPWKIVILQGGTNDINFSIPTGQAEVDARFMQMKRDKIDVINLALNSGLIPVCVTIPPNNNWGNGANPYAQSVLIQFNTWLNTYCTANGISVYDVYADMDDGTGRWKPGLDDGGGVHPRITSQDSGALGGAQIWGQHLLATLKALEAPGN